MHLFLTALLLAQAAPPNRPALMPLPAAIAWKDGRLRLDSTLRAVNAGFADGRLRRAVNRAMSRLARRSGLPLIDSLMDAAGGAGSILRITVSGPGQAVQTPEEDESYRLEVTPEGITLAAPTVVGALRGLETVLQLVTPDSAGFGFPSVLIEDRPRFPWRGLLLDVVRHWMPPEVVRRTLDGMAAVKLNVLHWHLSDDQGFRVESRRYPRLQEIGSDGLYYTQDQVRELVSYARDRGIRVVPEFDLPGHSTSWFVGYPQYASAPGPYTIERQFGVFDPAFDPSREDTFGFLDGVIGEMAALFPDPYWHIGGDEVTGKLWDENPRIIRFKRQHAMADDAALQAWFNGRLSQILTRHQRQMIGWDEILHPDLPRSTVVQSWRGPEYLEQAAQAGYRGILSAPYYLDHMLSAGEHYLSDPSPPEDSLTPEQAASILGGEACMWAEHVSPETVDSRIWPRTAAIAERFWSPSAVRDVDDMYRRLSVESVRLEELGLTHEVHSARMLRRIVGARKVEPLRKLLEITEPVTFRQRVRLQAPTQLTPLTHLVDAARPDPWMRHDLERLAAALDTNPGAGPALEAEFRTWLPLPARLAEMARDAPLASEGEPAARAAAQIAQTGLEALGYLRQGSPPPGWVDRARLLLAEAEKPQGLLHLVGVDAVRSLVERVAERGPAASR